MSFESFNSNLVFLLLKISQHFCVPVNNNRLGATENLSVIVAADKCAPEASLISTTEKKEIKNKKIGKWKKKIGNLDCQSQTTSPQTLLAWGNDHLIEFHLIEIVIFHLIESFN